MKRTKFQRFAALTLTFVLLLSGTVTASAAGNSSVTDSTIESMRDILGAVSYEEYCMEYYEKDKEGNVVYVDANGNTVKVEGGVFKDKDGNIISKDDCEPIWLVEQATEDIYIDALTWDKELSTKEAQQGDPTVDDPGTDEKEGPDPNIADALWCPQTGEVSWKVNIEETARYTIKIEYYPVKAKNTSIGRIFKINGKVPFSEARYLTMSKVYTNEVVEGYDFEGYYRPFKTDFYNNEFRPTMEQSPEWREYVFKDSDGFSSEAFEFVLEKGENILTLTAVSEPVAIKSITLCAPKESENYADFLAKYEGKAEGSDKVTIQAESPSATSSQTVYPVEDRASALTQPSSTKVQLLNTIGGEKWQVAGQWVRYDFEVNADGMYEIVTRFKQNILDGMYSSRAIHIYSEGLNPGEEGYYNGLPFTEANELRFGFNDSWQTAALFFIDEEGNSQDLKFFFKAGVKYHIEFEVTLGDMGDIVRRTQESLTAINAAYLNILKLTGTSPDPYRDYGFYRVMPETMIQMKIQSRELYAIAKELVELNGEKSSNTATLEKVADLLDEMSGDEKDVARNLDRLKSYIGTLGTWISDAKTQPLQLDYILVQGTEAEIPKANSNFWESLVHEVSSFIQSFFRDYNHMGAVTEADSTGESLEVWLAYGRDQSQVIRNLVNNEFTPYTDIAVDLKLVAGGTLLPSILAKMGPDVYIGIGQGDIINYAIRGALLGIEDCEGFEEFTSSQFNDAAMTVLGIADAEGKHHYYGLPETQDFPMMFVRTDILANLDIEIPKTWDDLLAALPMLQANNMEIGLSADTNVYLYQMGGTLFADDGMRINLDSNVGLEAFTMMCDMYTMYSFPYSYNFSNRFRTGEMPIGIGGYCGTYNTLVVFATEIRGLWQFFPLPGIADEQGNINNVSVSSVSAVSMINDCKDTDKAWAFMKWQTGADFQAKYSNEMIAILGDSAKHATANMNALDELTWTQAELTEIKRQFSNLASVPNYPGAYIVGRYTNFAFLAAYNDMEDPSEELLSYINTINKEISRKREEFGLETLEIGQTLADKRIDEVSVLLEELDNRDAYAAAIKAIEDAIAKTPDETKSGVDQEYLDELKAARDGLAAADAEVFATIITKLDEAIEAFISYNVYY